MINEFINPQIHNCILILQFTTLGMSCFQLLLFHDKRAQRRASKKYSRGNTLPARREPSHSSHHPTNENERRKTQTEHANDKEQPCYNIIAARTFAFAELASATRNFREEYMLGEGGFGPVYIGHLEKTDQTVAVKQLNRNGLQGNREFLVEVLMLSLLHSRYLVNLIGYCADGEHRLLVYEYMSMGSLEDHLLDLPPRRPPLAWQTRMKIAMHAAKGLEYLHDKANPPVIYRDLKSSNILLDKDYNAKLSDFGLAKLGPVGDKSYVSTRVMGTYGYCAPEYQRTGQLTAKSDVYSFGVVFLELITGRRAVDWSNGSEQLNLVTWAEPILREPQKYYELADPLLEGKFPRKSFNQAVAVAVMCLQDVSIRPVISDVVTALSCLAETETRCASPIV